MPYTWLENKWRQLHPSYAYRKHSKQNSLHGHQTYKQVDEVLVYHEKEKIKWTGSYKIKLITEKQSYIEKYGTEIQHSLHQLIPYFREFPSICSQTNHTPHNPTPFAQDQNKYDTHISEKLHHTNPKINCPESHTAK